MSAPALDLQKAVLAALADDEDLTSALGGARIYDHVPAVSVPDLRQDERLRLEHVDRGRLRAASYPACVVEGAGQDRGA